MEKLLGTLFESIMNHLSKELHHEILHFFSWVENKMVSDRMIEVFNDVKKIFLILGEGA